jgi:hypothetical protein
VLFESFEALLEFDVLFEVELVFSLWFRPALVFGGWVFESFQLKGVFGFVTNLLGFVLD